MRGGHARQGDREVRSAAGDEDFRAGAAAAAGPRATRAPWTIFRGPWCRGPPARRGAQQSAARRVVPPVLQSFTGGLRSMGNVEEGRRCHGSGKVCVLKSDGATRWSVRHRASSREVLVERILDARDVLPGEITQSARASRAQRTEQSLLSSVNEAGLAGA